MKSLLKSIPCLIVSLVADAFAGSAVSPKDYQRTAFLGDSITDGNTYPALVRDALIDAGLPPMVSINAGIGGDTAKGMRARVERDVLSFHPTLVTLSAGANDALRGVGADDYERDVRGIIERLRQDHVPLILLTPNLLGPKQQAKGQKNIDAYEAVLRKLSAESELRVAEVNERQKKDLAAGHAQLCDDDLHPNYQGQRMIAQAVLDAMGYPQVKVPERAHNRPMPGLIADWKLKPLAKTETPAPDQVAAVKSEADWISLHLPETEPASDADSSAARWLDDYRMLGMSISLRGKADRFLGVALISSDRSATRQLHTGGELNEIWLNGARIYQNTFNRGYHPGRESVSADLKAGENRLVILTGATFFLSMTDGPIW